MKKRKTALLGFLLTAMLGIGVGYAAVTDVLDVTGKVEITEQAAVKQFDEEVYFTSYRIDNDTLATASINTNDNDKASFTVKGLTAENNKVVITYTIANSGNRDVSVKLKFRTNYTDATTGKYVSEDGCFEVTNSIGAGELLIAKANSGEVKTANVEFTITLTNTPTKAIDESFIIEFEATPKA